MTELLPQLRADYDHRLQEELSKLRSTDVTIENNRETKEVTEPEIIPDLTTAIAESMLSKLKSYLLPA